MRGQLSFEWRPISYSLPIQTYRVTLRPNTSIITIFLLKVGAEPSAFSSKSHMGWDCSIAVLIGRTVAPPYQQHIII